MTRSRLSYRAAATSLPSAMWPARRPTTWPGWRACCMSSSTALGADRPAVSAGRRPHRPVAPVQRSRPVAPLTLSREAANAVRLDRWLIDRCQMESVDGFSTRDVLNGGPNGTRKREDFMAAVEELALHGRVRLVQDGKRRRLAVNPALLDGTSADDDDSEALDVIAPAARPMGWNR